MLRVFVLADGDAHNLATFLEMLSQLLLVSPEINVSNEHTACVWVVFLALALLYIMDNVWLGILFVYNFGYLLSHVHS